jgi:hypothetical protein
MAEAGRTLNRLGQQPCENGCSHPVRSVGEQTPHDGDDLFRGGTLGQVSLADNAHQPVPDDDRQPSRHAGPSCRPRSAFADRGCAFPGGQPGHHGASDQCASGQGGRDRGLARRGGSEASRRRGPRLGTRAEPDPLRAGPEPVCAQPLSTRGVGRCPARHRRGRRRSQPCVPAVRGRGGPAPRRSWVEAGATATVTAALANTSIPLLSHRLGWAKPVHPLILRVYYGGHDDPGGVPGTFHTSP